MALGADLVQLATRVAREPELWPQASAWICAKRIAPEALLSAARAAGAPEDNVFLLRAMAFSAARHAGGESNAVELAIQALEREVNSDLLMPLRIELCEWLLPRLARRDRRRINILAELGRAHAKCLIGDRWQHLEKALEFDALALAELRALPSAPQYARLAGCILTNLGNAHKDRWKGPRLENLHRAMEIYREAERELSGAPETNPIETARARVNLADAIVQLRQEESGWEFLAFAHLSASAPSPAELDVAGELTTAGELFEREGLWPEWAIAWTALGNFRVLEGYAGDRDGLRRAVACYEAVLANRRVSRLAAARARLNLGVACGLWARRVHEHDGELPPPPADKADHHLREAVEAFEELGHARDALWALMNHGALWIQIGRAREAGPEGLEWRIAEGSFRGAEKRLSGQFEDSGFEARKILLRREATIYDGLTYTQLRLRNAHGVAHWSESGRARSVNRALENLRGGRSSYRRHESWPEAPAEAANVARRAGAPLLSLRPTPWGTCLSLMLPDGRSAAHLLEDCTIRAVSELLNGPRQDGRGGWIPRYAEFSRAVSSGAWWKIESAEERWRSAIDATLKRLGEMVWQPTVSWLSGFYPGASGGSPPPPLIVMPGIGLNILPLHAAISSSIDGERRACDEYQISQAASVRVLHRCLDNQDAFAQRATSCVLGVQDPGSSLDWPEYEIRRALAHLRPQRQSVLGPKPGHLATPERILEEIRGASLALLCLHGRYDVTAPPEHSGLFAADPQGREGIPSLSLSRVLALDLSNLWLVILSACESALGDFSDAALNEVGLASLLTSVGACTAIGTLWTCSDAVSGLLIPRMCRELTAPRPQGAPTKAAALWRAQQWLRQLTLQEAETELNRILEELDTLDLGNAVVLRKAIECHRDEIRRRGDRPYAHPHWWSVFVCHGAP